MIERKRFPKLISLVAPVYNEALTLPVFFEAVAKELAGLPLELLFVDDGSVDETFVYLKQKAAEDSRVKVLKFSRNFGKEAALTAGLAHCRGEVVIPIDVDLQDPITVIHAFLEQWQAGFDVVHGVRQDRKEDTFLKRFTAHKFYQFFNRVSDVKMVPHSGDFRLMDRKVVDALNQLPERVRFMKGLFSWVGFSATEVYYSRVARQLGSSKFNFTSLWRFGIDGVISFSSMPIRIWSLVGVLMAIPALFFMLMIVLKTLVYGSNVPGYASLVSIILFIGGIQLITLGVIGEYIGRIFTEVKARPVYILEEIISIDLQDD